MNQDQGRTGGFFSKLLQRVKGSPAEGAADLQAAKAPYSKQALNQGLERKRRNDAIRAQEFSQLRQLRRQGRTTGTPATVPASAFLPSSLEVEARTATTLQKIDAIEAQMARQWRRAPSEGAPVPVLFPEPAGRALPHWADGAATRTPHGLSMAQLQAVPVLGADSRVPGSEAQVEWRASPDMEEAAIFFAHGDLDGAKARLLELLVQALDRSPVDNTVVAGIWHAVLDLHRATGDADGFQPLASDYAAHFGGSVPLWFSMPAQLGIAPLSGAAPSAPSPQDLRWNAPAILTAEVVAARQAGLPDAGEPAPGQGLAGVIEGDAMPWLQPLKARARLGEPLEIRCDRLIRLDFVAAGSVLNWACEMQAYGHRLRFTQLHHLVAVFFQVIGIPEHACVAVRRA